MRKNDGTRWGAKIVLVLLAAACGAGAWYARGQQEVVGADAESAAATESAQYIQENLTQALKHRPSGDDPEKLQRSLDGVVPVDVVAMRLWDADGTLVYSSVTADETTVPVTLVTGVLADGTAVNDPDAATKPADERPSLGVVETHAVPEDEEAHPQAPQVVDEASAIRAELERMGEIVQHAGETGDVEGLRGRLTKSAARKKGRVGEDGLPPS